MATPTIFQQGGHSFVQRRFQEFLTFYVTGFYDLCQEISSQAGGDVAFFYPSSIFVDKRPANMTEYTMAKVAGEILCADMQSFEKFGKVLVRRLPRLPTDQTAALHKTKTADPIDVILPIVRDVHANLGVGTGQRHIRMIDEHATE